MRTFLITASIAVVLVAANYPRIDFSQNDEKGIQFEQATWNEVLALAKKENKLIFVDVYATWCAPCKAMKRKTFSDEKVGIFFNDKFINVAVDGEKPEGSELAKKFGVRAYPTVLIINSDGELVSGAEGFQSPDQLMSFGKNVLKQ